MNKICGVPFFRMTFHHDSYGGKNIAAVPCCGAWLKKPYDIFSIPVKADLLILNKAERWGHNEEEYFNKNRGLPEGWVFIYKDKIEKVKKLIEEHNFGLLSNII